MTIGLEINRWKNSWEFIVGGYHSSTRHPNMTSMRGFGGSSVLRLATIASVAAEKTAAAEQISLIPRLEGHRHG